MRIIFTPPSEEDLKKLFKVEADKNGGSIADISLFTPPYSRGAGVISVITNIAKSVFPFLLRSAKPTAQQFGVSVLNDIVSGRRTITNSLKKRGLSADKQTGRNILKGMKGSGRKIKLGRVEKRKPRQQYKRSVFDLV